MKKIFRSVVLISVMSLAVVSCQKETLVDPSNPVASESVSRYSVCYTVDGKTTQVTIAGEAAWNSFLHRLFALAEEGHTVSFRHANQAQNQSKEKVTYTTSNEQDAFTWAEKMFNAGYEVTITFDEETGIYTFIAIK